MSLDRLLHAGPLKVRDVWSPDKAARLPHEVLQRCRRRALTRASLGAAVATMIVAALPLIFLSRTPALARKATGRLDAGSIVAAIRAKPEPPVAPLMVKLVTFKDGSRAELSGSVSQLKVDRDAKRHVDLRLLAGHARFEVVPNRKRSFEVQAGGVRVRVVGTSFSMARLTEQTRVSVDKGRVQVFWSDGKAELAAGQSGVFPPPSGEAPEAVATGSANRNHAAPEWRRLAQSGEYKGAYSALSETPNAVREVPEELMLAADVARLSGNPARAVPYLKTVSERFTGDPRAPVAAFTLGRVLLDNLGSASGAAAAFHRARTLSPGGPLALDAWAREVESLRRCGRAEQAAQLAQKYLEQFPNGRHARAMRNSASK